MIERTSGSRTAQEVGDIRSTTVDMNTATAARTGLPAHVRWTRLAYAFVASVFVVCVVAQVFFAGVGAFGADWSYHVSFVQLLELILPPMFILALIGRLPLHLRLSPVGLWVLITAQYALVHAGGSDTVAALHAVNALLIFSFAVAIARKAWRIVLDQRERLR